MKLRNKTFPYPVLSRNNIEVQEEDFSIDNYFKVKVSDQVIGQSQHELVLQYILKNDDLQRLINIEDAKVVAHLESGLTSFRKIVNFPQYQDTLHVKIDPNEMAGNIDLTVMIVANKDIENYKNVGFNKNLFGSDYTVKNLSRGDILAFEPTITIQMNLEDTKDMGAQTFIKVAKSEEKTMDVDLDSEMIMIKVPKQAYNIYSQLQNSKEIKLANVALLLPALMVAIDDIKNSESTNDEYIWYQELEKKITDDLGYNDSKLQNTSSIIVAQQLLNSPIVAAFSDIMEVEE